MVRWWLTGLLIFIPFQMNIIRIIKFNNIELFGYGLSTFINRLDEVTIFILFPFAMWELYRERKVFNQLYIVLLIPIFLFVMSGLMSGSLNGNSLSTTILGIIDYMKIFIVSFVYAAYFKKFSDFKKLFRFLLIIAVFLGIVALFQELWALGSVHLFDKNIRDLDVYILRVVGDAGLAPSYWRFGIYRTPSLLHHSNYLGFYCLLILTIYLWIAKEVRFTVVIPLFIGIVLSISRMVYLGFAVLVIFQIFMGKKWFLFFLIPVMILFFYMSTLWDFNVWKIGNFSENTRLNKLIKDKEAPEIENAIAYREYAKNKAIEIWKDHCFFGVGPGMFGGFISIKMDSYIYEEYNFTEGAKTLLYKWSGIDQYWPQLLAETGILGALTIAAFFISLLIIFSILRKRTNSNEIRGLYAGLALFILIAFIWNLGGPLKGATIFTYFAFVGMAIGCYNKQE